MIKATYEQLINKISRSSGLNRDEIERRVEAKIAKLSNLISKEGALQVVAAELGISFDNQKVKINELLVGMRKISVIGKILKVFPIRAFKTKTAESKVISLLLGDETGTVRVVLWDTNHIALFEEGKLHENSVIEIKNGSVRGTDTKEIHVGSMGEINESSEKIENVIEKETIISRSIAQLHENERARIRGTVVQGFEPRFFFVCPECKSRVNKENEQFLCAKHGAVIPLERALLSLVIDDGSGNMRVICFSDAIKKLFDCEEERLKDPNFFLEQKKELMGSELFFTGRVRKNKLFDALEFIAQDLNSANVDEVISELEQK